MRIGVNSGSLPKHLHELERENPVEALVTAAVEFVELMESLDFENFKVSIKSTNVPNTIAANRLLSERIPYPLHLGITEAGTKWSGSLKSAVGLGTLLADGVGDTIRISLSTFHAEEEVKVAWEILKALQLRERGPVLIACPTCGRLQFDMDTVVAEIEQRLEAYTEPIEVAVLGCAVNGIGEASHADFGITGAKNEGLIFAHGKPLRKVPQEQLVDALFEEIDKSLERGGGVEVDEREAAEGAEWLAKIEEENAGDLTPERIAQMEKEAAEAEGEDVTAEPFLKPVKRQAGRARRGGLADGRPALHPRLADDASGSGDRPEPLAVELNCAGPRGSCRPGHHDGQLRQGCRGSNRPRSSRCATPDVRSILNLPFPSGSVARVHDRERLIAGREQATDASGSRLPADDVEPHRRVDGPEPAYSTVARARPDRARADRALFERESGRPIVDAS